MNATQSWSVASPPAAYGDVDDERKCRHVRVRRQGLSLDSLKRAVLRAYEDQYEPSQIKLFARQYDDEAKLIRERGVSQALSYEPDWTDVAPDDDGSVLLIVSAMNEEESELLIMPAAFSASRDVLLKAA